MDEAKLTLYQTAGKWSVGRGKETCTSSMKHDIGHGYTAKIYKGPVTGIPCV